MGSSSYRWRDLYLAKTAGSILFSDGSKIAEDNANLYWDNVNKRLGIGNPIAITDRVTIMGSSGFMPLRLFSPSGATGNAQYQIDLKNVGAPSNDWLIGQKADNHLYFAVDFGGGAQDRLIITNAGNVGIGTTSPAYKLDVNGSIRIIATSAEQQLRFATGLPNEIGFFGRPSDNAVGMYDWANNRSIWYYLPSYNRLDVYLNTYFGGNVGIGTTTPDSTLHILHPDGNQVRIESSGANPKLALTGYDGASKYTSVIWGRTAGQGIALIPYGKDPSRPTLTAYNYSIEIDSDSASSTNTIVSPPKITFYGSYYDGTGVWNTLSTIRVNVLSTTPTYEISLEPRDGTPLLRLDNANKIWIGDPKDTNLYRAAANVLKTDSNFDALALRIGGVEVISSDRVLKNVTVRRLYTADETEVYVTGTTETEVKHHKIVQSSTYGYNVLKINVIAELKVSGGTGTLNVYVDGTKVISLSTTSTTYTLVQGSWTVSGWTDNTIHDVSIRLVNNTAGQNTYNRLYECYVEASE